MHYPQRWDPTFGDFMTYADLFAYPPKHFHRHLAPAVGWACVVEIEAVAVAPSA